MAKKRSNMIGFRLPEEVIELLEQEAKRHGLASVHEVARTILINTLMGVEPQPNELEKKVIKAQVRTLAMLQRLIASLPDELLQEADNCNGRGAKILVEGSSDADLIMRKMGIED
ncbi:hypothetical protein MBH78_23665 [Oceanimonas sp. NS1]|nr:hypothetical protein [Oceanimonas sp. NS1]